MTNRGLTTEHTDWIPNEKHLEWNPLYSLNRLVGIEAVEDGKLISIRVGLNSRQKVAISDCAGQFKVSLIATI